MSKQKALVVLSGPRGIGKTSALQLLEAEGFPCVRAEASHYTDGFELCKLKEHIVRWVDLWQSPREQSVLVEESPWTYYARFEDSLTPSLRQTCRKMLAELRHADYTVILQCSGIEVSRRQGPAS